MIGFLKSRLRPLYRRFRPLNPARRNLARRYLRGRGIEIGALHFPLEMPRGAQVQYVDRMKTKELRCQYPELAHSALVEVTIVDDGETLGAMCDASQDFVVANHLIEHCQNPISSIENWLRVLRPGGILFCAVPDKRYTFDWPRQITPLEHVRRDYDEGPAWSRRKHFREAAEFNGDGTRRSEEETERLSQRWEESDYSIHFHVWTQFEFFQMLCHCRQKLAMPFDIEAFQKNNIEFIVVLRKHEQT